MNSPLDIKMPLEGIPVVDFGHYLSGPLAGMLLADQGAEVIKVQKPTDKENHDPLSEMLNRGKQIVVLDLKSTEDQQTAVKLIQSADVVNDQNQSGSDLFIHARLFFPRRLKKSIKAYEGILGAACGLFTDIHLLRKQLLYTHPAGICIWCSSWRNCCSYGFISKR